MKIQDVGFHPVLIPVLVAAMFDGGGGMHPKVQVPNPVTYLNSLFYEVMRRQNPHLPIPTPAIVGFGDLYKPSFYQYAIPPVTRSSTPRRSIRPTWWSSTGRSGSGPVTPMVRPSGCGTSSSASVR